jgi:hypothetical protein
LPGNETKSPLHSLPFNEEHTFTSERLAVETLQEGNILVKHIALKKDSARINFEIFKILFILWFLKLNINSITTIN